MKILLLTLSLILSFNVFGGLTPLPVTAETIGLWNFNNDENGQVFDEAGNPLTGQGYSIIHEEVPGLDSSFGKGYRFHVQSSFIDLGTVSGSKIDFTAKNEFSVEAVIHLSSSASSTHIIFSTDNVRLLVINNQLAGSIRQPGGLFGLISENSLSPNTSYRVGLHYLNGTLALTVNGKINSKVKLDYPVSAPEFSSSRGYIGGDILGRYFPGYIDDVRVSNDVGADTVEPVISLIEPASFQVGELKPFFRIKLEDEGSGVDPSTVQVYLNGEFQDSLNITSDEISGYMKDELITGLLNEVRVVGRDLQGNFAEKYFYFVYSNILHRGEYETDQHTLALWHMNDFTPGEMQDGSGKERHGRADPTRMGIGEGVFSKGKIFNSAQSSAFYFDGIRFNQQFTFEGWFRPSANHISDEILFYNGQITVARVNGGQVRTIFHTTDTSVSFLSSQILLPQGELHHLAVTWDGKLKNNNLKIFINGQLAQVIKALSNCDFDPFPKVGILGERYTGLMDEVRVSDIPRASFNIPTLENQIITFMTLKNGTSTHEDYPELRALMNSANSINVDSVRVRLNGVIQPGSENLVITESSITGKMQDMAKEGINNLEIEFFDNHNNLRKKSQYFFKVKRGGSSQYSTDENTVGLWHFEGSQEDSSGNNNHLVFGQLLSVDGEIGMGQGTHSGLSGLDMFCRSHTFEGYFRPVSDNGVNVNLYMIQGGNLYQRVGLDLSNGNIHIINTSNSNTVDSVIPNAFPIDGAYHHVATVYDGSRGHAQLLLLVDGEVKGSFDSKNSCDVLGGMTFNLGASQSIHYDEVRISKVARYEFNLLNGDGDRPEIELLTEPGGTIQEQNFTLEFNAHDTTGVDLNLSKILLNGNEQTFSVQNLKKARFNTRFSSELSLSPGANEITLSIKDYTGNETFKRFYIYYFSELPHLPYQADDVTEFLYHFDEEFGNFQDDSGKATELNAGFWTRELEGVFNRGASNWSNSSGIELASPPEAFTSYTFEAWLKRTQNSSPLILFSRNSGFSFEINNNSLGFRLDSGTANHLEKLPEDDSLFHHYALVVDIQNPLQNIYLLMDGKVIWSSKLKPQDLLLRPHLQMMVGSLLYGSTMDEARFSSTARYELVSKR